MVSEDKELSLRHAFWDFHRPLTKRSESDSRYSRYKFTFFWKVILPQTWAGGENAACRTDERSTNAGYSDQLDRQVENGCRLISTHICTPISWAYEGKETPTQTCRGCSERNCRVSCIRSDERRSELTIWENYKDTQNKCTLIADTFLSVLTEWFHCFTSPRLRVSW